VRPIHHAVPGALVELLRGTPLSPGKVGFAWRTAVGPAVERVTSVQLAGRVLVVETSGPQWAREVTRSADVILTRLQTLLGKETVTSITVRTPNPEL
jgi:predicted nucleic acid-binding Zn ribbon protein